MLLFCVFCTVVSLGRNHFFFLCAVFISHIHILKKRRTRPTQGCRANDDDDGGGGGGDDDNDVIF